MEKAFPTTVIFSSLKIWTSARPSSTTASSSVLTPLGASPVSAPLASLSTRLPALVSAKEKGNQINLKPVKYETRVFLHFTGAETLFQCFQTTTSAPLRAACVVPGPRVSTRLVASTVNAPKGSPWTQRALSVKVRCPLQPEINECFCRDDQAAAGSRIVLALIRVTK